MTETSFESSHETNPETSGAHAAPSAPAPAARTTKPAPAKPSGPKVGQLVAVRDGEGTITRLGMVVGAGKDPNPNHTDEYGNLKPETRQPVVAWFSIDGQPSPYGLELSPLQ